MKLIIMVEVNELEMSRMVDSVVFGDCNSKGKQKITLIFNLEN